MKKQWKKGICAVVMGTMLLSGCSSSQAMQNQAPIEKTVEKKVVKTTAIEEEKTYSAMNQYEEVIQVKVSKEKAKELAKEAINKYFQTEVDEKNTELGIHISGGYSVYEPEWYAVWFYMNKEKKEKKIYEVAINANTAEVITSQCQIEDATMKAKKIQKLSLEEKKKIAMNFLKSKQIIEDVAKLKFVKVHKGYSTKTSTHLEFTYDQYDVNVKVDLRDKKVKFFYKSKDLTQEERKQLDAFYKSKE
ncbi:hypothetical protein [Crassaminicella profunda]|uniref:hypothetical protein n=1 Tax=Crassaminicella profunda TaxID=1286698 RepID=UPI001CA6A5F1|nr:hypothetical protein [Crassaminicella profunda]QZY54107.1 hypothetical protein K7H06_13755 [Crassaminicella profunda]